MSWRIRSFVPFLAITHSCAVYDADLVSGSREEASIGSAGQGVALDGGASSAGGSRSGDTGSGARDGNGLSGSKGDEGGRSSTAGSTANSAGADGQGGSEHEPLPTGAGTISYGRWNDVPGGLIENIPFNEAFDETFELDSFRAPSAGENYAARMRGSITPPIDGNYRFWIACDHNCELWLSPDETLASEVRIASVLGSDRFTASDEWWKYAEQESSLIPLEAGKRYHVTALLKQGGGGDNLSVGWLKPGEVGAAPSEIIPGTHLSPVD